MGQEKNNRREQKWKQLSEKERYKIEAWTRVGIKASQIAEQLGRDRRTIEREQKRGSVVQRHHNSYASKNPAVPEYL